MSVDYPGFFEALCGASVEFILVGGTAANVHGGARLTQDVDIVHRRTRENVSRLAARRSNRIGPICVERLPACPSGGMPKGCGSG